MANWLGNFVDIVGTRLNLPEMRISERLSGGNTVNTQNYQYAQGNNPYSTRTPSYVPTQTSGSGGQQRTWRSGNMQSSQPTGGGGGSGGGGGGNNNQPQISSYGYRNANGDWVSMNSPEQEAQLRAQQEAELNQQIDSAYNPAYENLNSVEAQYKQEFPTLQAGVEQSYASMVPEIQKEQSTELAGINTQRATGTRERTNQLGSARNLYNELQQGLLTRFGGASSTGQATQELLGRETSRQFGDIQSKYGDYFKQLEAEEAKVNTFYTSKLSNLEKEKQLKLQELQNTLDSKLREINGQRATLDSEKAAKRLGALMEISAQARQIKFEAQAFQRSLDAWRQMKDEALRTAREYNAKSVTIPGIPNRIGQMTLSGMGGGTGSDFTNPTGYYDPEQLKEMGLNPYGATVNSKGITYQYRAPKDNEEDIFGVGSF